MMRPPIEQSLADKQQAESKYIIEHLMEIQRSMKRMNRKLEEIVHELARRRH